MSMLRSDIHSSSARTQFVRIYKQLITLDQAHDTIEITNFWEKQSDEFKKWSKGLSPYEDQITNKELTNIFSAILSSKFIGIIHEFIASEKLHTAIEASEGDSQAVILKKLLLCYNPGYPIPKDKYKFLKLFNQQSIQLTLDWFKNETSTASNRYRQSILDNLLKEIIVESKLVNSNQQTIYAVVATQNVNELTTFFNQACKNSQFKNWFLKNKESALNHFSIALIIGDPAIINLFWEINTEIKKIILDQTDDIKTSLAMNVILLYVNNDNRAIKNYITTFFYFLIDQDSNYLAIIENVANSLDQTNFEEDKLILNFLEEICEQKNLNFKKNDTNPSLPQPELSSQRATSQQSGPSIRAQNPLITSQPFQFQQQFFLHQSSQQKKEEQSTYGHPPPANNAKLGNTRWDKIVKIKNDFYNNDDRVKNNPFISGWLNELPKLESEAISNFRLNLTKNINDMHTFWDNDKHIKNAILKLPDKEQIQLLYEVMQLIKPLKSASFDHTAILTFIDKYVTWVLGNHSKIIQEIKNIFTTSSLSINKERLVVMEEMIKNFSQKWLLQDILNRKQSHNFQHQLSQVQQQSSASIDSATLLGIGAASSIPQMPAPITNDGLFTGKRKRKDTAELKNNLYKEDSKNGPKRPRNQ